MGHGAAHSAFCTLESARSGRLRRAERRRSAVAVVGVGLFATLTALVGLDARATDGARVSGDEPQYLLTATSLGEDGDLDISDELAERRYEPYHEIAVDPQTTVLDASGRQVSPHDPLLPALLALPMRLGGWVTAKALLAVVAGVTAALTTWVAVRRVGVGAWPAASAVGAAFAGIPLAAYGTQVYPELPAALTVMVAVAFLTAPSGAARHLLGAALAVVALPWLAVKYVPVATVLGVWVLARTRRVPRRRAATAAVASAFAGAAVAFLVAHRVWYGGWTVYAAGDHFADTGELSVVGTNVNVVGRARRLAGLWVDRDFGIAAWSPVWLLGPAGLALLLSRPWRSGGTGARWWVLAAVAAGWLNATFVALTMHGWWVPGRQVVVVLPLVALGLAALADRAAWLAGVVAGLGVLGLVGWVWLAVEASTDRRTLIVDFFETAAWPHRALRPLLPAGMAPTAATPALLVAWGVALAASVAIAVGARPPADLGDDVLTGRSGRRRSQVLETTSPRS